VETLDDSPPKTTRFTVGSTPVPTRRDGGIATDEASGATYPVCKLSAGLICSCVHISAMDPVNENDLDWTEYDREEARFRRKKLAEAAGGEDLGCSLYELPPGRRAWPFHFHTANEEALYVLGGEGQLMVRTAGQETAATTQTHQLEPGDYVALPTGDDGAHRVSNTGDEPLQYLAISTMRDPDVLVYPDSGKVGVYAGAPPGGDEEERVVSAYFHEDDAVDYWEGED
jgi:uncharacterized cupin superfamily protein